MAHRPRHLAAAALAVLVVWACTHRTEPYDDPDADLDADSDADTDADGDVDADLETDADGEDAAGDGGEDADVPSGPGPITLVVRRAGLTLLRLCDLDGDGDLDNALADLGTTTGELAAMALNAALQGGIDDDLRYLVHIPWVEERRGPTDPSIVVISIGGVDRDDPVDPSDDFSGHEPFWGEAGDLDGCGEPVFAFAEASLDGGSVSTEVGTVLSPLGERIVTRGARGMGSIAPGGLSAELLFCAYATIADLGAAEGLDEAGELSMLEIFLAGGEPLGVPMIPGLSPDVDLDRDGLESFVRDESHHIVQCIDGDLSVIPGSDCWSDPRMADAFGMNLRLECVAAELLGRQPGWEEVVEGTCPAPPERSLFDPS